MICFRERLRCVLVLCVVLSAISCGGEDKDDNNNGSGTPPPPLKGGERLSWDQQAASVQLLRALTFRLYVDDDAANITEVRCNEAATASGYLCSGLLPAMSAGSHALQLSSILNGVESPRSPPVTVTVGASSVTAIIETSVGDSSNAPGRAAVSRKACLVATASTDCFAVRPIARGVHAPTALTLTPDDRVFFIEDARHVRVIAQDSLVTEPALTLTNPSARIVGLAVDPEFVRTRAMFVAWTEPSHGQVTNLNVTRYRELQNTLGEGATIVSGVPVPADTVAPIAMGSDGLLYLAVTTHAVTETRGSSASLASILRVTRDGLIPSSNPRLLPMLAGIGLQPGALAVDKDGRAWVAGHDQNRLPVVSTVSLERGQWAERPVTGAIYDLSQREPTAPTLSVGSTPENATVILSADGRLFRGLGGSTAAAFQPLNVSGLENVRGAAQGPSESWYLVTGPRDAALIVRLVPE